ncbi:DUF4058 domain-containing protein [Chroococcidiopsis sp. CCALA 051]|uniref:DUF4058 family protein n=1 Tax=Chroococcidiopsis sp. CCALA 051 TaxID=869949 RepID=UPI000D0D6071|nr:DUF4058 family protein [Chroococcidiopsis sp. CCALA 051]MBE9016310.1 DUF4058 family protein [Chroococcidiopsidales cyanobacterium LEGE 13417]PSM46354.1 DUF4058 domain-containing protein [Chroococcidiopsis sp. CCALA 051]
MVLLDHFHPPLSVRRHWHAFHNAWATYIASDLNQHLPQGYFAEPNVQFGIEIDVAAFDESTLADDGSGTVIALPLTATDWQPAPPTQTIPFQPTRETVEISIFSSEAGPTLAGAIELVSPANKDCANHRDAFVAKCQTYLNLGIGLVVVDVVTSRNANLHAALMQQLGVANLNQFDADLYAVAYRIVERTKQFNLDMWQETLSLGTQLPILPLWLPGELCLPVDLDATYQRTCREQRIGFNSA